MLFDESVVTEFVKSVEVNKCVLTIEEVLTFLAKEEFEFIACFFQFIVFMDTTNDEFDVFFESGVVVSFHDEAGKSKEEDVEVIGLIVSELYKTVEYKELNILVELDHEITIAINR